MVETGFQRRGELVRGVFEILQKHPDGLAPKKIYELLERRVPPTPYELSKYPKHPGVRRYENIVRFSTIRHVKAGWLIKGKSAWSLTDDGLDALRDFPVPEAFDREVARIYPDWKKAQDDEEVEAEPNEEDGDDGLDENDAGGALERAEEDSWSEINNYLSTMHPYDFQELVAALLRAMGYHVSWVAPPGKDGGLDILAHTDPLGVSGPRIKVQVKRQQNKISVDGVRSFIAVLGDNDVGIYVNAGGFTRDAEFEARGQEKRRLTLLDLAKLFDLWVEHYEAVAEPSKSFLPLRPVYFLADSE